MLIRFLTIVLFMAAGTAQGQAFSLPGIGDLEQQLTGGGSGEGEGENTGPQNDQASGQQRQDLEQTLTLRREIDDNRERIEDLDRRQRQAPARMTEWRQRLETARAQQRTDWKEHYGGLSLSALGETLGQQLEALEANQEKLAKVSSELTGSQTLPERAQNTISESLARTDDIRRQLNRPSESETLDDRQRQRLQVEQTALESRIELRNQELSVASTLEELSRLRQRVLEEEADLIQQQLDVLQPLINQRRAEELREELRGDHDDLPEELADHPALEQAQDANRALRDRLVTASEDVNDLLREVVSAKTQLDRARTLASTVDDQVRMLEGSLLLSRILYEQQKSLPEFRARADLQKQIADTRLAQFEISQQRQELERRGLEPEDEDLSDEQMNTLRTATEGLADQRLDVLNQLDQELGRKLNLLVRLDLSQNQLVDVSDSLHDTISEQTFWMPSTQPLNLDWFRQFPALITERLQDTPWKDVTGNLATLIRDQWFWLLLPLTGAGLLTAWRRSLRARVHKLNSDIGFLRRDSQRHTPLAILLTTLMAAPVPLALSLVGWGLLSREGSLVTVLGETLVKIALLWLVFELCYRMLARDGVAQRHFRWSADNNVQLRRRLLAVGLAMVPMSVVIAFGERWPAQLSNDRIGLIIMVAGLAVIGVMLTRIAHHFPGGRYSTAFKGGAVLVCAGGPLVLVALIGLGYYYTSVRLTGRIIDSFYLLLLWIVIDATAVRGLAVAAQRLAYKRAVAQRDAEPKENVEGVEVEEPQLDLEQVNQQSLRLIRLGLVAVFALLLYWVWSDILSAFSYTDNILLWESVAGQGENLTSTPISLGDVMTALALGVITIMLAINLPGLLEVLLLSRMRLKQGTSYATTTLLSYVIVVVGIIFALGSLGLSWSKMQWLVAALGVGLGFGLQEIFANFISGIIILFERPIRIGDVITINNLSGTVSRIRIRATTVIDFDRKEIIIPNKTFVTERLINWSLTDTVTRVTIKVGFAYGSDLDECRALLTQVARDNARVLHDPEPLILFMAFGDSTLDHELRVHVKEIGDILAATDELNRAVDRQCRERGVEIAFNQMDVHLRSATEELRFSGDTRGHYGNSRTHYHDEPAHRKPPTDPTGDAER